jgi:hypothetical protein
MLVKALRSSRHQQRRPALAALASIGGSILTWRAAKSKGDPAHAERFGIFIGLWAPTFFALADGVKQHEVSDLLAGASRLDSRPAGGGMRA